MALRKSKIKRHLPWWLGGGHERCAGCDRPQSHHASIHCAACDRGFCATCVEIVKGEPFCSECQAEGGVR